MVGLGLAFCWRRKAFGRSWAGGPGPDTLQTNGLFLGFDLPTSVLIEIGIHEYLGREDLEWGGAWYCNFY